MFRHYWKETWAVVLTIVLGTLVFEVCWFFSDARAAEAAHDDAVAMWESHEPTDYSFDFQSCSGFCGNCPVHVTVHDGEVTDAVRPSCAADEAPTIEEVFAMEERGRGGGYGQFAMIGDHPSRITYDLTWGFPAHVSFPCDVGASDCGSGYDVSHFHDETRDDNR